MITGSKAAFAALVFADAFFQHGEEVFVGQIHRKPEALPEHVDHAVICQEDGVPTCDRVQIQFVRNAIHLIGIDVCEQDLISDNDGHDGIASNHGDKDDAVNLVVLVDGDIGVTMLLHNVEAGPDDLPAVSVKSISAAGRVFHKVTSIWYGV